MSIFSAKYLNDISILKNAYVGFEFEFYSKNTIPYYKLIEKLNNYYRDLGISVQGIRKYHPDTKPSEKNFILTPDFSGGMNLCELITGKMEYNYARTILLKTLKFIQENGYTTDRSSVHINISFNENVPEKAIEQVNKLKLILNIDEDLIYKYFPNRKESFYAKSVKRIIPFKQFDYSTDGLRILQSNLELPDDDRYYGVNFIVLKDGRLEFRYIGDVDYEKKPSEILELMDYFIVLTWKCINENLTDDDVDNLQDYLNDNINVYKNFNKLDSFIGNFPTIQLEVDKNSSLLIVNVYYGDIYDELYDLVSNTFNLSNCIINYSTSNKKFEVVDANIKSVFKIKGWTFIDSTIAGGDFENCEFISCSINNSHLSDCEIKDCDSFNCKLMNTNVDNMSELNLCYVHGGLIDGNMKSGVLRLAKIGQNGEIGDEVKIVSDTDDYFGIIKQTEEEPIKKPLISDMGNKKVW
jgi:hypothetical protein